MNSKRRLPRVLAVVVGSAAALAACSSPPPADSYNCLLRHGSDGGAVTVFKDGTPVEDTTVCHAPNCNGSFDGGLGMLVYRAPNGDEAPNCMV